MDLESLHQTGELAAKLKTQLSSRVKLGVSLLSIAEWIEQAADKHGFGMAFPVNISINSTAAHFTPAPADTAVFEKGQLVKIDFGFHKNGWPVDNAVTIDLGKNTELVKASEQALDAALDTIVKSKSKTTMSQIGSSIESVIKSAGFSPITNLTGHQMGQWNLHSGFSIQNYDTGNKNMLGEGLFAIEPFATNGVGKVKNGKNSSIYRLLSEKPQRLPQMKSLLKEVSKFKTFPFASRWVSQTRYLQMLVRHGVLHNYPELVEAAGGLVSQAEDTILVTEQDAIILTRR
ncbi:MAG: type II methionyl aminopeptidase [Candidatus Altiarchaeota archaeon]|nr:type II methionyl aminopeptidase [Candidatus Altiarchaeota archaeon]